MHCAFMVHLETGEEKHVKEKSKEALIISVDVWRGMGYAVNSFYTE